MQIGSNIEDKNLNEPEFNPSLGSVRKARVGSNGSSMEYDG